LVKADPAQVEQVIVNLAVNARDAMPNGGRLTIETASVVLDEHYAAGHLGAQPGDYILLAVTDTGVGMTEEVKTRLFEPFFTTKSEGKGTGLGLATVYGITILLVEDDPEVRNLTRRVLHRQGYTLLEAADPQEALLLFSRYSGPIHLVLTDVVMPGMNGKSLVGQLSQIQPNLKALFISGYTDNVIAHHGVLDPHAAFLEKPFSPVKLARKVREVLDQDR
jgi:CheY-like chemotaxis protein